MEHPTRAKCREGCASDITCRTPPHHAQSDEKVARAISQLALRHNESDPTRTNCRGKLDAHLMRACAVEMRMDISRWNFSARIGSENAGGQMEHPDLPPAFNSYRKKSSAWTRCLRKMHTQSSSSGSDLDLVAFSLWVLDGGPLCQAVPDVLFEDR